MKYLVLLFIILFIISFFKLLSRINNKNKNDKDSDIIDLEKSKNSEEYITKEWNEIVFIY